MPSLLLYRAATLVAAGFLIGAAHSAIHAAKKPLVLHAAEPTPIELPPTKPDDKGPPPKGPGPVQPPNGGTSQVVDKPAPKIGLHITIEQAKALYDQKVPFVDARHLNEYEDGHVENAFLLSSDDVTSGKGTEVLNYLDRSSVMVVYCNGGACDASENLVAVLQQAGYSQARIMTDGYPAWEKAGYPTAKGKPLVGGGE